MKKIAIISFSLAAMCAMGAGKASAARNTEPAQAIDSTCTDSPAPRVLVTVSGDGENRRGVMIDVMGLQIHASNRTYSRQAASTDSNETVRVRTVQTKSRRASPGHIGFLEFGFNMLTAPDYSMYPGRSVDFLDLRVGRSMQWGLRLFRVSAPLTRSGSLSVSSGLQLMWNNYTFSEDIYIYRGAGRIEYGTGNFKKSKLSSFGFRIPLLIEFNLPRRFFLAVGGYAGLDLSSRSKMKRPKTIIRDPYMNAFTGGLTARAGYGSLGIYVNYNLTSLFQKNKGPETSAITFGFSIGM